MNSCEEMDLNDRFAQYDVMSEEEVRKEAKSYQEYKLYCQLKVWFWVDCIDLLGLFWDCIDVTGV